jgi:cleavage and polyadenylation specificity factor subunit 2
MFGPVGAHHHSTYPISFLTVDYVKSFLEWISGSIENSFEHTHDDAFQLKHFNVLLTKKELKELPLVP